MNQGDYLPEVTTVEVIGDHELRLTFDDGTVGDISFADREWTGVFEPLRDPARFANVQIEAGTVVWPDDGLDMAPEPLYEDACRRPIRVGVPPAPPSAPDRIGHLETHGGLGPLTR
jgi:hypothetical protein